MTEKYKKIIMDPIHGNIGLTEKQVEVINLPVFQRLRRISQLSFADYVYPNATHNRFSHCLGVMHLGRVLARHLDESGLGKKIGLKESDYESIIWAGLLHDIGHLPFSHASEPVFAYFMDNSNNWKGYHERISAKIIKDSKFKIKDIIGRKITEKVVNLINSKNSDSHPLLREALTGVCCIDRLDYLKRDAHHAGTTEYAIVDPNRILTSIVYFPQDSEIAPVYRRKAICSVEGAIISYFYMYRTVYYHHAARSVYMVYQNIIWDAFKKYNLKKKINNLLDPQFWNSFDDCKIFSLLNSIEKLRPKFNQLIFREFPKEIPLEKIRGTNIMRIFRFFENNDFKDKIALERRITRRLKETYPELETVLLDSPVVMPYPTSLFAKKSAFVFADYMQEPKNVAALAPYLTQLQNTSERLPGARVYIYPESLRRKNKFIKDLNSEISSFTKI